MTRPIRNSAKALIIENQHVLLIQKQDGEGVYYIFPGGGQEKGETLEQAVQRECIEELDVKVLVQELSYIREYIGKNHEFAEMDEEVHQVEFYFQCEIQETSINGQPIQPDTDQIGIDWLPLEHLADFRIYPRAIVKSVQNHTQGNPVYLGDVN